MWTAIVVAAAGCYLMKLAGLSVPRRALDHPRVEAAAARLPIALLAALAAIAIVAVALLSSSSGSTVDPVNKPDAQQQIDALRDFIQQNSR